MVEEGGGRGEKGGGNWNEVRVVGRTWPDLVVHVGPVVITA